MLRYLRIAVTALSLTACVLLIALWVRSYWYYDAIHRVDSSHDVVSFGSNYGTLFLSQMHLPDAPAQVWELRWGDTPRKQDEWFSWYFEDKFIHIEIPFLAVVPVLTLLSVLIALPGIRWPKHFSLRTLLIATTLVAVGLGVVIYLTG